MASDSKEVEIDFSPYLKVYKDGTVERIFASPYIPPSPDSDPNDSDPITDVSTKDVKISTNVSARIYLPKISTDHSSKKLPILVYFHGGAFCLESAFGLFHHRHLNQLVSKANALAISVEYRLAPEHPLPAAYEDSWEALQWVASHFLEDESHIDSKEPWLTSHGDFGKVYLGGDSAGGNIAHKMAMKAGEEGLFSGVKISGAFLSFPFFCDSEKMVDVYKWWELAYPSLPGGIKNPLMNPLADGGEDLSKIGCGKVFVCCSEKDELREINLRYAAALKKSGWGGDVAVVDVEGEGHCFQLFDPDTEEAQRLICSLASFING